MLVDAIGTSPTRALDLGSGAGVPGLILAWRRPEARVTLLETSRRRAAALAAVVGELGWGGRVDVAPHRAEDRGRVEGERHGYELVVARSFGPPAATAECGAPFLAPGGRLFVSEPPEADRSTRWPPESLRELGLELVKIHDRAAPAASARYAEIARVESLNERFPRRSGIPARRPLWR